MNLISHGMQAPSSCHHLLSVVCLSTFSIIVSKTAGQIEAKFYVELPSVGGMKSLGLGMQH